MLKNFRKLFLLFAVLFLVPHISHAQKMLGADITYQHVGIDSFEVNITAYVFCDGSQKFPATGKLVVTPENSSPFTVKFKDSVGGYDITPVSRTSCTSCRDTSCSLKYGIQQYFFTALVDISKYKDCKFTFGWQGTNRKINGKPIYVEAFLNKCKNSFSYTDYSSPIFTNPPFGILCYDKCNAVSFNTKKWLYQHDSLSYTLIKVRTSKDSTYKYPTGYDSLKPFSAASSGSCKGIVLDGRTGMMYFTPTKKENAVVAVRIDYWSADSTGIKRKINSVMRDLEISFMDCDSNSLPYISGIGTNDTTGFDMCVYKSGCFTISTTDANSADTVLLTSDVSNKIPGASFDVQSGKKLPSGYFCWTPQEYHARTMPYQFTATTVDNRYPVNGRSQKVFEVMVHPSPVVKLKAVQNQNCDIVTLTAIPEKGMQVSKYEWDFGHNRKFTGDIVKFKPAGSGKYYYSVKITSNKGCQAVQIDSFIVKDVFTDLNLNDTTICYGDSFIINSIHGYKSYSWSPFAGLSSDSTEKPLTKPKRSITYLLKATDTAGCTVFDSIRVNVRREMQLNINNSTTICYGDSINLSAFGTFTGHTFAWYRNGSLLDSANSLYVKPLETTTYSAILKNDLGCSLEKSVTISLSRTIAQLPNDTSICFGDTIKLNPFVKGSQFEWWPTVGVSNNKIANPLFSLAKTTRYILTVSDSFGCKAVDTIVISVEKLDFLVSSNKTICKGDSIQLIAGGNLANADYGWYADSVLIDTAKTIFVKPENSTTYSFIARNTLGCKLHKDVKIDVINFVADAGNDVKICKGDSILLHANNGLKHWWKNQSGNIISTSKSVYVKPQVTQKFYAEVTGYNGCSSVDSVAVTVNDFSYTISKNTTICYGDTATISVSGGNKYKWMPNSKISSTTSSSPKVYPSLSTTYYVEITDTVTGCKKYDSILIIVDTTCVWPGDANLDKTADYLDILDIAIGYSTTGIPRVKAFTDWIPQLSKDWTTSLSSGVNYKHLDSNGDSLINANDTLAVVKNYGKSHLKNEEPQLAGNPNDPPLYFQFDEKYYLAGDTVNATLYLGNADKPVKDVYGLGLKHFFGTPYMETATYSFVWNCDMLCGAKDNFQLYRQFNDKGTGEGSLIRTDKQTTSNPFGKVAEVEFVLRDSIFNYPQSGVNIALPIIYCRLVDMLGNEIPVYTRTDSVKVYRVQSDVIGIKENNYTALENINIYPNPANNLVYIDGKKQVINEVTIVNIFGQTVVNTKPLAAKSNINISNLPAGIYFVQVKSDNKFKQQKLIITK